MIFTKLSSGHDIPLLGLGTFNLFKPGEVKNAVMCAIDAGYRHIDCAAVYGNEKEIGEALSEKLKVVDRKELFITSKLWNTKHNPNDVLGACKETLRDLQLEYLDLYLIHWPTSLQDGDNNFPKDESGGFVYAYHDPCDTWKAMEKLVEQGLVRSIGVSNFNSKQVDDICAIAKIKPAVNQVECNPYLTQTPLLEHCKKHNIILIAHTPLGKPNRPWAKPGDPNLLDDPKITAIAQKYNKTAVQVSIRFQVQRGVAVIPKSVTPKRIIENFQVFDFELTSDEMATTESLNIPFRICYLDRRVVDGKEVFGDAHHPHYPFNIPY